MIKVIAEIGWNHCGDMSLAKQMAKAAQENGATYAKYQTWSVSRLKPGSWDDDGRREIYEKAELSKQDHIELIDYCTSIGIKFLSSVFSIEDAKLLVELGCKEVKIPSFESRNHNLIEYCGQHFETVFMSTGTSTLEEIKESSRHFGSIANWYLMHCVSTYPCDYSLANLPKMLELKNIHHQIGYSDHTMGVAIPIAAVILGATVIEKHFTLSQKMYGSDAMNSIEPDEFKRLVDEIRMIEIAMNSSKLY